MILKNRLMIWTVLLWAIFTGCLVTDLFVCPRTVVFPSLPSAASVLYKDFSVKADK